MEQPNRFNYVYSAKQQQEIRNIRQKYAVAEPAEDKLQQLRRLDAAVTQRARTAALVLGIVGTLILGFGMSLVMTELGWWFGWNTVIATVWGAVIGIVGMIPMGVAYPLYNRMVRKQREKIAPEMLRLSDELLQP